MNTNDTQEINIEEFDDTKESAFEKWKRKTLKKIEKKWDNACARHKSLAWVDDNILYWLWRRPKDAYYSVRCWFRYNWCREHWELLKAAFHSYPWDPCFLTYLEERQIDKYIAHFKTHQRMIDEQYNEIVRSLRWAKYCISIINDDSELFHYDGEMKSVPQIKNEETGEWEDVGEPEPMLTGERKVDEGPEYKLYRIDMDSMKYVYDGPRVNTRNAARFLNKKVVESDYFKEGHMRHELYVAKCRHLYYLIRERCTDLWWD
jgi:hypothetical protein